VSEYLARIAAAGITWPLSAEMTDAALERLLFINGGVQAGARYRSEPDWAVVARELKRPGVTLMILWEEYRGVHPDGYAYSRYCQLFARLSAACRPACGRTMSPATRASSTTLASGCRSSTRSPAWCTRPRSSSPCWVPPT